jgi:hypothetical protein
MVKRKDEVEELEEAGLVNKHIFWRSVGGNVLEGQGYEFMTEYDTIVSQSRTARSTTCTRPEHSRHALHQPPQLQ